MSEEAAHEVISLDLSTNAIDSIKQAIDLVAYVEGGDEKRRLKQAILSISHGVELLLKERLRRVHPSLVWENVDKYRSLDARTVGTEQALLRLRKIGGVNLPEADIALVKSLRNTRNAIEHFSWTTTRKEATAIVGRGLSFAMHFAEEHLGLMLFGYESRRDPTFAMLWDSNQEFAKSHQQRQIYRPPAPEDDLLSCDFCRAIGVPRGGGACTLCGHWHEFNTGDPDEEPF